MKYKGYEAVIKYDEEDRLFFGRVINVQDVIVFDGLSVDELEQSFHLHHPLSPSNPPYIT